MNWEGASLTWLGHATFIVETPRKKSIVIDPWLTGNPKCPESFHQLDRADVILITHGHFDHMGSAVDLAKRTGASVIGNFEIMSFLESQGVENTIGMNKGGTVTIDDIHITMVHADHSSGITTPNGLVYGGEAAGFVLTLENGLAIYHAGDTNVFGDMAHIAALYAPEVALLPIGGHFTMSPKEAAYAVRLLKPQLVIPMHYGTFPLLAGTPEALADLLAEDPVEMLVAEPGRTYQ